MRERKISGAPKKESPKRKLRELHARERKLKRKVGKENLKGKLKRKT
jgi:hypothetical protein